MLTVAEFNTTFSKSIRNSFFLQSMEAIENSAAARWMDISDTTEYTESYTSTEAVDLPSYLNEGQVLPTVDLGKGYKATFDSAEVGSKIKYTYKARLKAKDSTETLLKDINDLKNGAIYGLYTFFEQQTHRLLNEAFVTTNFAAPDGKALCANDHTRNSTGTTFDNLLAASALDVSVVDTVEKTGGAFVDAQGQPMSQMFNKIIVKKGGKAAQAAKRIFGYASKDQFRPTSIGSLNIYEGAYTIIETPWITSNTAYFFMSDAEMSNLKNPLFAHFMERPKIQGDMEDDDALNRFMKYAYSFKFGIRNLPFNVLGSE
jgi:hypothetical protein